MGHCISSIMILGDVGPNCLRRPGAMTLDILHRYIEIERQGGT